MQHDTLERLWESLGLDSLPADAGTAQALGLTHGIEPADTTLSPQQPAGAVTEREDLPRLSLSAPALAKIPGGEGKELVVTGVLGQGGMGQVLLARQGSLGRDVAVKVSRTDKPGAVAALVREGLTCGALEHPGVVPVYSLGSDTLGNPALVMKRVDGVSWSMLLRHAEDPLWSRVASPGAERIDSHVEILRQVCNAIAFAHRKGVLHRDIKPANVLIGEFGEVYVADWGIATRKGAPPRPPSLVGTPVYLAPEMVHGDELRMDERTDVFLLGATLYEVLTGAPPWSGPDLKAVLQAALYCAPAPPPVSAPPELVAICRRAMAPHKEDRYQSVLDFRDALGGFLRHRGSVQLADAAVQRLATLKDRLGTQDTGAIYPLLSECRFGFTLALREWPDNTVARRGLAECIEATARFELRRGNVAAARALAAELEVLPPELHAELTQAETLATVAQQRAARIEHLSNELDPRVAQRERLLVFAIMAVAIVGVLVLPALSPFMKAWFTRLGTWHLVLRMGVVVSVFFISVGLARRSVLSTRLNRRLVGMVGVAGVGVLLQRVVAVLLGLEERELVLHNFALLAAVCAAAGLSVHWGFYLAAGAVVLSLAGAMALPGYESMLFAAAGVSALVVTMLSWRGWRGEMTLSKRDEP